MNNNTILIKQWNAETNMREPTGEEISIYKVAKSMSAENFAKLFEDYLNLGSKQFQEGRLIGLHLRHTHRTLQRLAVCFALGMIVGLSEQEYTDARNETAVESAKLIAELLRKGQLPLGFYV